MRYYSPTTTFYIQPPLFGKEEQRYEVVDASTGAVLYTGPLADCQYYITHKLQQQSKLEFGA